MEMNGSKEKQQNNKSKANERKQTRVGEGYEEVSKKKSKLVQIVGI